MSPQPTASEVHVDAALTNISVAYIQQSDHFVAGQVFPRVEVQKQSDKYFQYTQEDWFRDEAEVRAPATESAGSGFNISSTRSYFCDVYALHKDVPWRVRNNADAAINPDRDATQFVTQRQLVRQEIQWVSEYFSTGVWDTTATPANLWSSYTTSDPITDIETGKETILQNTGFEANTLVMDYKVWRQIKHHPDFVDRFKYTSSESITTEMVAQVLELERVLVVKSIKNTAAEGVTAAYSFMADKDALLCFVNPTPGLLQPSAGYNFMWQGVSQGLGTDISITRIEIDIIQATRIEAEVAFDFKVIGSNLGYFFSNAVA